MIVGEGEGPREVPERHTDFETLVRSLILVKRNIVHEITKFQERRQRDSETIKEYYRSLRALVAHCESMTLKTKFGTSDL